MISTYFGIGKPKAHVQSGMCWVELGMFPIEAYAYVAILVRSFSILSMMSIEMLFSFTTASICGEPASTVTTTSLVSRTTA
jgi:hypothetical protein